MNPTYFYTFEQTHKTHTPTLHLIHRWRKPFSQLGGTNNHRRLWRTILPALNILKTISHTSGNAFSPPSNFNIHSLAPTLQRSTIDSTDLIQPTKMNIFLRASVYLRTHSRVWMFDRSLYACCTHKRARVVERCTWRQRIEQRGTYSSDWWNVVRLPGRAHAARRAILPVFYCLVMH